MGNGCHILCFCQIQRKGSTQNQRWHRSLRDAEVPESMMTSRLGRRGDGGDGGEAVVRGACCGRPLSSMSTCER